MFSLEFYESLFVAATRHEVSFRIQKGKRNDKRKNLTYSQFNVPFQTYVDLQQTYPNIFESLATAAPNVWRDSAADLFKPVRVMRTSENLIRTKSGE